MELHELQERIQRWKARQAGEAVGEVDVVEMEVEDAEVGEEIEAEEMVEFEEEMEDTTSEVSLDEIEEVE